MVVLRKTFALFILMCFTLCFSSYFMFDRQGTLWIPDIVDTTQEWLFHYSLTFLCIRHNGILNPFDRGQHHLYPGVVQKDHGGKQEWQCLLLSSQHLFSPGHGAAGCQGEHLHTDVRGINTHARSLICERMRDNYFVHSIWCGTINSSKWCRVHS